MENGDNSSGEMTGQEPSANAEGLERSEICLECPGEIVDASEEMNRSEGQILGCETASIKCTQNQDADVRDMSSNDAPSNDSSEGRLKMKKGMEPAGCQRHFRELIGKHRERNEELGKRQDKMRQRMHMLECSVPAAMVWNIWRMAQGAPVCNLRRVIEKQFREKGAGICVPLTPSRHYDCRVREAEAERKQAEKRVIEARALWEEKQDLLQEKKNKLEEAKRIQEERKERMQELTNEVTKLKEELTKLTDESPFCIAGECGDIECRKRWLMKQSGSATSIGSCDVECLERLQELAEAELSIKRQMIELERREHAYMRSLQQADELWSKMEGDTASTMSALQIQLNAKNATNQQLADRICELEDQLEKTRARMGTCRAELEKYLSLRTIEALIGRDDDLAEVADKKIGAKPKLRHEGVGEGVSTTDAEVLARKELMDRETWAKGEHADRSTWAKPDAMDAYTEGTITAEEEKALDYYMAQLGSLEELDEADDYAACATDFICNDVVTTDTGLQDEELAKLEAEFPIMHMLPSLLEEDKIQRERDAEERKAQKAADASEPSPELISSGIVTETTAISPEKHDPLEESEAGRVMTEDDEGEGVEILQGEKEIVIDMEEGTKETIEEMVKGQEVTFEEGIVAQGSSIFEEQIETEEAVITEKGIIIEEEVVTEKQTTGDEGIARKEESVIQGRAVIEEEAPIEEEVGVLIEETATGLPRETTEATNTSSTLLPVKIDATTGADDKIAQLVPFEAKDVTVGKDSAMVPRAQLGSWLATIDNIRNTTRQYMDNDLREDTDNLVKQIAMYAGVAEVSMTGEGTPLDQVIKLQKSPSSIEYEGQTTGGFKAVKIKKIREEEEGEEGQEGQEGQGGEEGQEGEERKGTMREKKRDFEDETASAAKEVYEQGGQVVKRTILTKDGVEVPTEEEDSEMIRGQDKILMEGEKQVQKKRILREDGVDMEVPVDEGKAAEMILGQDKVLMEGEKRVQTKKILREDGVEIEVPIKEGEDPVMILGQDAGLMEDKEQVRTKRTLRKDGVEVPAEEEDSEMIRGQDKVLMEGEKQVQKKRILREDGVEIEIPVEEGEDADMIRGQDEVLTIGEKQVGRKRILREDKVEIEVPIEEGEDADMIRGQDEVLTESEKQVGRKRILREDEVEIEVPIDDVRTVAMLRDEEELPVTILPESGEPPIRKGLSPIIEEVPAGPHEVEEEKIDLEDGTSPRELLETGERRVKEQPSRDLKIIPIKEMEEVSGVAVSTEQVKDYVRTPDQAPGRTVASEKIIEEISGLGRMPTDRIAQPPMEGERRIPRIDPRMVAKPYLAIAAIEDVESPHIRTPLADIPCVCEEEVSEQEDTISGYIRISPTPPPTHTVASAGIKVWQDQITQYSMPISKTPEISAGRTRWQRRARDQSVTMSSSQTENQFRRAPADPTFTKISSFGLAISDSKMEAEREIRTTTYTKKSVETGSLECICCQCGQSALAMRIPMQLPSAPAIKPSLPPSPRVAKINTPIPSRTGSKLQNQKVCAACTTEMEKLLKEKAMYEKPKTKQDIEDIASKQKRSCTCMLEGVKSRVRSRAQRKSPVEKKDQGVLARIPKCKSKSKVKRTEHVLEAYHSLEKPRTLPRDDETLTDCICIPEGTSAKYCECLDSD